MSLYDHMGYKYGQFVINIYTQLSLDIRPKTLDEYSIMPGPTLIFKIAIKIVYSVPKSWPRKFPVNTPK